MNKLGVSLPWDYISGSILTKEAEIIKNNFNSEKTFLVMLKDKGVSSIELRHRHKDLSLSDMYNVIENVKNSGLDISVHGDSLPLPGLFSFTELFPWNNAVNNFYKGNEDSIVITFHPIIKGDNKKLSATLTSKTLTVLSDCTGHPSYIYALENQRSKGYKDPGITFNGVVSMVSDIPDEQIGICWDMGHSYSNVVNFNHPLYPPDEFLKRVIHTHIHDLGPTGRTHWPFKENKVPLKENVNLLKSYNYKGTYNLELSFDRFAEEPDIRNLVMKSIRTLKKFIE